jgi:hypothetical protein
MKKFFNQSHQFLIETIESAGVKPLSPIIISADQFDKEYSVLNGGSFVDVKIKKTDINEDELREIPAGYGPKIIVNKIWTCNK